MVLIKFYKQAIKEYGSIHTRSKMFSMSNTVPLKVALKVSTHNVGKVGGCSKASEGMLALPFSWTTHTQQCRWHSQETISNTNTDTHTPPPPKKHPTNQKNPTFRTDPQILYSHHGGMQQAASLNQFQEQSILL